MLHVAQHHDAVHDEHEGGDDALGHAVLQVRCLVGRNDTHYCEYGDELCRERDPELACLPAGLHELLLERAHTGLRVEGGFTCRRGGHG